MSDEINVNQKFRTGSGVILTWGWNEKYSGMENDMNQKKGMENDMNQKKGMDNDVSEVFLLS